MIRVLITGTTSGIGKATYDILSANSLYNVESLNRDRLDLSDWEAVRRYKIPEVDVLINNAGGRQDDDLDTVMVNFLSPMTLARKAFDVNPEVIIINNTSSYCHTYWGNDLIYSASKKALAEFRKDFMIDHPSVIMHEVRPGLTLQGE